MPESLLDKLRIVEEEIVALRERVELNSRLVASFGSIDDLVERVSEKILANFYQNVGRSVTNKFLWAIGIATVVFLGWLGLTGKLRNPQ